MKYLPCLTLLLSINAFPMGMLTTKYILSPNGSCNFQYNNVLGQSLLINKSFSVHDYARTQKSLFIHLVINALNPDPSHLNIKKLITAADKTAFDKIDGKARLNWSMPTRTLYALIYNLPWNGSENRSGIYSIILNENPIELHTARVSLDKGKTEELELFSPTNLLETNDHLKIHGAFKRLLEANFPIKK